MNKIDYQLLALVLVLMIVCSLLLLHEIPRYHKLTMQQPDGSQKIFIGLSAKSNRGSASWVSKDRTYHVFTGPHWLDEVSSDTYNNFKLKGEKE